MLATSEALNCITTWLENQYPQSLITLQTGLPRHQIESKVSSLQLPDEFYELYQWRNGTWYEEIHMPSAYIFFGSYFMHLGEPYVDPEESNQDYKCIFTFSLDEYSLVLDLHRWKAENFQAPPVVMMWTNTEEPEIEKVVFQNLTSMLITLAEALEAEACWVDEVGYLTGSDSQLKPIHQKYNPDCEEGFCMWLDWWLKGKTS